MKGIATRISFNMLQQNEVDNLQRTANKEAQTSGNRSQENAVNKMKSPLIKRIFQILILLVVILVIHSWWTSGSKDKNAGKGTPPVPVLAGKVMKKDVPVYLDGLGTVQAYNTVTIHVRVDGQLVKVAFNEGQDVHEGDLLAQIDPAPYQAALDQALAKKAQDAALLANDKVDLQRYSDLYQKKVIPQQQYDTQVALVNQVEATVKADEAAVESAKVNLDYTAVRSPLNGRAGLRLVDQGNIVHAADATGLVVLTQLQPIFVAFTLPEQNLGEIHKHTAQNEDLEVLALGRDNKTVLDTGKLQVINNQIDPTTGTIQLKAVFQNPELQLWPGQFVNIRLHLTTRKEGLVVPASVVQRGPDGSYAFVIKKDETVEIRPVKVSQTDNGQALIDEGLQEGEQVVVDGQYKLQDGSHVKLSTQTGGKPKASASPANSELK